MRSVGNPVLTGTLATLATAATLGLAPGTATAATPGLAPGTAAATTLGLAPGTAAASGPGTVAGSPKISVNWFGTADRSARHATIGGRYDCGTERGLAYIEVHLDQRARRASITGFGFGVIGECSDDRTAGTWTATIPADSGAFRGGPATAIARLVVEPNSLTETTEPLRLLPHCARR